jgi:hypothetical protein
MAWKSNLDVGLDSPTDESEHVTFAGEVKAKNLSRLDTGDIGGDTRADTPDDNR